MISNVTLSGRGMFDAATSRRRLAPTFGAPALAILPQTQETTVFVPTVHVVDVVPGPPAWSPPV